MRWEGLAGELPGFTLELSRDLLGTGGSEEVGSEIRDSALFAPRGEDQASEIAEDYRDSLAHVERLATADAILRIAGVSIGEDLDGFHRLTFAIVDGDDFEAELIGFDFHGLGLG